MSTLKPVSQEARSFLELLGESAEQHQKQVLMQMTTTRESATKKALRELNSLFEKKHNAIEPAKETVKRIEEHAKPIEIWKPHAYILFVRRSFCKTCKEWEVTMDQSSIFLEQRKARHDPSHSRYFTPIQFMEHPALPRLKETIVTHSLFCLKCFTPAETLSHAKEHNAA